MEDIPAERDQPLIEKALIMLYDHLEVVLACPYVYSLVAIFIELWRYCTVHRSV
jgi:hypothetical protein